MGLIDSGVTTEFTDTVRMLPRGVGRLTPVAEVAVVGCFRVNGATETQLANDFGRSKVESFVDGFFDFTEGNLFGAKGVQTNRDRVGVSDGVGELDLNLIG